MLFECITRSPLSLLISCHAMAIKIEVIEYSFLKTKAMFNGLYTEVIVQLCFLILMLQDTQCALDHQS